jgi:hypothetical protein
MRASKAPSPFIFQLLIFTTVLQFPLFFFRTLHRSLSIGGAFGGIAQLMKLRGIQARA